MCGIAGIVRRQKAVFDYSTFCTLGIANDSRGGDSCGVFIDKKWEYGVQANKYFQDYMIDNEFLTNTKTSKIALLHCRKASVGNISEKTAQPVVITDAKDEVKFVLIHNGTIYNYEELAEKYIPEVDIKGMTDSQVMARIFYYKGYDVLSEYRGGSVFVMVDYRPPEPLTLMFKGASKKTELSKDLTEERPLYLTITEDEVVFSSICSYLYAVRPGHTVYTLKQNTLCTFNKEDGFKIGKLYDRKNCCQSRPVVTYANVFYEPGAKRKGFFDRYDDDYDGYYPGWRAGGYYTSKYLSSEEKDITFSEGGHKAHGRLNLTKWGRITNGTDVDNYEVWFFHGIAMRNRKYFKMLSKLERRSKMTSEKFVANFQNLIRFLSLDRVYFLNNVLVEATGIVENKPFTGSVQLLGKNSIKQYKDGKLTVTTFNGEYDDPFKKLNEKEDLNIDKIYRECK